jgi:hypothetical protein
MPQMKLLQILPAAAIILAIVTISLSCSLATYAGHIPQYPQISMCGMYTPERYVFSLGLNLVAFLIACLLFVNFCRTENQSAGRKSLSSVFSGVHLGFGISSSICLALMATIPVSEYPVAHVLFAIGFFVFVLIYQVNFISCIMDFHALSIFSGNQHVDSARQPQHDSRLMLVRGATRVDQGGVDDAVDDMHSHRLRNVADKRQ